MFVEMWGFQLSLLSSISVIISGFSFCLRRGTFVGRKYPKAPAFLEESSQRTKKYLLRFYILRYLFPIATQNSAWVAHRRLRRPMVRLRSSNSLLYSACAVLSENPAGGNQAAIVKLQHKQNPAGEAPTGIFHLHFYFLSGFSLIRHPLALGAVSPGDAYIV